MEINGLKWMKKNFIMLGIAFLSLIIALIALKSHFSVDEPQGIDDSIAAEEFISEDAAGRNNMSENMSDDAVFGTQEISQKNLSSNIGADNSNSDLFNKKQFVILKKYVSEIAVTQNQIITEDEIIPPAVKNITIDDPGIGDRLNIFWEIDNNPKIKKIRVYRFEDAEGAGTLIAELNNSEESFTDKGLSAKKTYYYIVKTVNENDKESSNTEKYSSAPTNIIPPCTPADIKIKQQGDKIEISWTNSHDDDLAYIYI
ncbi:MAG: fibronectin type III domain-containing protein [bacterium]